MDKEPKPRQYLVDAEQLKPPAMSIARNEERYGDHDGKVNVLIMSQ